MEIHPEEQGPRSGGGVDNLHDQGLMNMPVLALNFAVNLNCSKNIKSLKKLI